MTVHLNNAGAGLMRPEVLAVMTAYLNEEAQRGSYETEAHNAPVLDEEIYRLVAQLLHTRADDVAIFGSATVGWLAAAHATTLTKNDEVWVTPYEYAGNLIALAEARRAVGFTLRTVPLQPNGDLDLDWMVTHLTERCALVSVPHVPSGCGIVNPVTEIGDLLQDCRALYFVDGCQAVGQLDVDVPAIGCDVYTGAGRKFLRGPRGTGFSVTSEHFRTTAVRSFHDLHVASVASAPGAAVTVGTSSGRVWETAERSTVAVVGLAEALRRHLAAGSAPYQQASVDRLRSRLFDIVGSARLIDPGSRRSNIVTVDTRPAAARNVVAALRSNGFNTWVMNGHDTPTYMAACGVDTAVRISPHHNTTASEIDAFCDTLAATLVAQG